MSGPGLDCTASSARPEPVEGRESAFSDRLLASVLALAFLALPHAAAALDVTASVDRLRVGVGEPFVLTIKIAGAQNAPAPELGDLSAFQAQYLGPSTQVSIINGQFSASVSHRYQLVARQPGVFTLGPFQVEYDGRRYEAAAIRVQVAASAPRQAGKAAPAPPGRDLRLVLVPGKTEVYVGERLPLDVKLYVGNVRVDDLQYPQIAADEAMVEKLGEPARREEILEGRRYQTLRFATALTALRPGPLALNATMGMSALTSRRRGGDPFFDQFFGGAFAERQPMEVRADPVTLTVMALPEAGRPADFSGAVGHFDFALSAKPTELAAGDPITVRMEISGEGNLSSVAPPHIPVDDRFRPYDPQVAKGEEDGGARVFEQVLIPKTPDVAELPAVRFSFFDPDVAAYRTITRGPIALAVRPAAAGEPKVVAPEGAAPAVKAPEKLGRDIVYIKDAPGAFARRGAPLYRRGWFLALQLIPVAAFGGLLTTLRRRARLAADPRLVRFRQAGKDARRALGALEHAPDAAGDFYDRLTAALHAYLGAKLDLPPGAIDHQRVMECLSRNGSMPELQEQVQSFFELVERIRYAPASAAGADRESALRLARGIVERLERQRNLLDRLAAVVCCAAWLASQVAAAQPPAGAAPVAAKRVEPHTAFFQANAAYQAGRYAEAAALYEQVLDGGVESGALYFNLGNTYFKNGQVGRAILNYERARRLLPRDPDVRVNLAYAREQAEEPAAEPPLWVRLAFPLAPRATSGELAVLASVLWFGFWAALAVRLFVRSLRLALGRAAWVALALWILVVGSLGLRVRAFDLNDAAVVTGPGQTAVRFEPSPTGTEHFQVREGALLDVTESREGWLQVRRSDGRRGWIPASAVTLVRDNEV